MPRLAAWEILRSGSTTPLREVDRVARNHNIEGRDRALLRRLVGTEVRRRSTLRAIVNQFTRNKPNADIAAHMRLGLIQLFFMDSVPEHAAVSETVKAATDTCGTGKGRLVNAVLRAAQRSAREERTGNPRHDLTGRNWTFEEPIFHDPAEHPALWAEDALCIPAALMKRWIRHFGEKDAHGLGETFLHEPDLSIRIVSGTAEAAANELQALFSSEDREFTALEATHPAILRLPSKATEGVLASAAFLEGRLTIQGETALRAAELMDAQPDERILDLCAAPGGKTAVLAGKGADVLAMDEKNRRLARLWPALERLSPAGNVTCLASDGTSALTPEVSFDGVLIDAPCSNTGVLGARPGARWRFGPKSQASLKDVQARLLADASHHVRSGGRLVYSTCSLEAEENDRQVRAFLAANENWELEDEQLSLPTAPGVPGPVDGGYAARLRKA